MILIISNPVDNGLDYTTLTKTDGIYELYVHITETNDTHTNSFESADYLLEY